MVVLDFPASPALNDTYTSAGRTWVFDGVAWIRATTVAGLGDVVGPASSTANAVARYSGTTGKLIKDSTLLLGDTGPLTPTANDGIALGTGTLGFADLFLATGGIVNWSNGNFTITHSTDLLTLGGTNAALAITSTNPTITLTDTDVTGITVISGNNASGTLQLAADTGNTLASSAIRFYVDTTTAGTAKAAITAADLSPGANDGLALGTGTLSWSDLFLANGGIVNWNNGNVILFNAATGTLEVQSASQTILSVNSTGGNAGMEIGRSNGTSSTPFVDFHSGATFVDYDTRLIASGGTGVSGGGTLNIQSSALQSNSVAVNVAGKQTIWVPATAMWKNTAAGGPSSGQLIVVSTNGQYLAFDPGTLEDAFFHVAMPKSWDVGTVTGQFYWSHPATATNFVVLWQLFASAYSDNDAISGTAYGGQSILDTGGTTNNMYISAETPAITVGNSPSANDYIHFIVRRDGGNVLDTLAVDAFLYGVKLFYTTNAPNDL